jgi:hypothetical protein
MRSYTRNAPAGSSVPRMPDRAPPPHQSSPSTTSPSHPLQSKAMQPALFTRTWSTGAQGPHASSRCAERRKLTSARNGPATRGLVDLRMECARSGSAALGATARTRRHGNRARRVRARYAPTAKVEAEAKSHARRSPRHAVSHLQPNGPTTSPMGPPRGAHSNPSVNGPQDAHHQPNATGPQACGPRWACEAKDDFVLSSPAPKQHGTQAHEGGEESVEGAGN